VCRRVRSCRSSRRKEQGSETRPRGCRDSLPGPRLPTCQPHRLPAARRSPRPLTNSASTDRPGPPSAPSAQPAERQPLPRHDLAGACDGWRASTAGEEGIQNRQRAPRMVEDIGLRWKSGRIFTHSGSPARLFSLPCQPGEAISAPIPAHPTGDGRIVESTAGGSYVSGERLLESCLQNPSGELSQTRRSEVGI